MSSQNNMAKESYPYKIIQSGYAPSSSHKIFISCTTPVSAKRLFSYSIFSNLSTFTQYMSVSHGYSTIGGIEWWLWRRQKGGRQSHINQAYQWAMEMPINRYQYERVGISMQWMHQSYKCMKAHQKKLSGCASNLLAHEDLGHLRKPIVGIYKPSSIMKIPTTI